MPAQSVTSSRPGAGSAEGEPTRGAHPASGGSSRKLGGGLAIGILCLLGFALRFAQLVDVQLDDAFITYRFAQNIADGHGIVWNPGEFRVEGYVNFLWMVLVAGALFFGIAAPVFAKSVSALSVVAIVWLLVRASRRAPWLPAFALVSGVAVSPVTAFQANMGLEAVFIALLVLCLAMQSVRIVQGKQGFGVVGSWSLLTLLVVLTRLDGVVFCAGIFAGLIGVLFVQGRSSAALRVALGAALSAGFGVAYFLWRADYFGHLLPVPFAIKMGGEEGVSFGGALIYLKTFGTSVLWPYALLGVVGVWYARGSSRIREVLPVLAGCLAFAIYLSSIRPIQGMLWRYIYPCFPALMFALLHLWSGVGGGRPRIWGHRGVQAVLAVLFLAFTQLTASQARQVGNRIDSFDRVQTGKRLAGLEGTMFVSEAGALPYYSGWRSVDALGLTSPAVAGGHFSIDLLRRLAPDLVATRGAVLYRHDRGARSKELYEYLLQEEFVIAATISKSGSGLYHVYYIRRRSPLFEELSNRLRTVPGVVYGDPGRVAADPRIGYLAAPDPVPEEE